MEKKTITILQGPIFSECTIEESSITLPLSTWWSPPDMWSFACDEEIIATVTSYFTLVTLVLAMSRCHVRAPVQSVTCTWYALTVLIVLFQHFCFQLLCNIIEASFIYFWCFNKNIKEYFLGLGNILSNKEYFLGQRIFLWMLPVAELRNRVDRENHNCWKRGQGYRPNTNNQHRWPPLALSRAVNRNSRQVTLLPWRSGSNKRQVTSTFWRQLLRDPTFWI